MMPRTRIPILPRRAHAVLQSRAHARGMTLIELVIVIVLSAIVVSFMSMLIVTPIDAFTAQKQRAQLGDAADGALRLMARDLRSALPNSVRTAASGTVVAIELLATVDGARYQDNGPLANAALWLNFAAADTGFSTTVPFTQITLPYSSSSAYLSIFNIGVPGANAYAAATANVITPAGTTIAIAAGATPNAQLVTFSPAFQFAFGSPQKRVYLVSGPVSYLCDTSVSTLTRYSGYTITATQPTSAATLNAAGAASGVVATNVAGCQFTYASGTSKRVGMASLLLQMANNGQEFQLLEQTHLVNAP
jgi:MSHA biogenesis protein MshO